MPVKKYCIFFRRNFYLMNCAQSTFKFFKRSVRPQTGTQYSCTISDNDIQPPAYTRLCAACVCSTTQCDVSRTRELLIFAVPKKTSFSCALPCTCTPRPRAECSMYIIHYAYIMYSLRSCEIILLLLLLYFILFFYSNEIISERL